MKTIIKKSILLFFVVLLSNSIVSQDRYKTYLNVNINGIVLWSKYSKKDILLKLGTPSKYIKDIDEEDGITEEFKYITSVFGFSDGYLTRFNLKQNAFKINNNIVIGIPRMQLNRILSAYGLIKNAKDNDGRACIEFYPKLVNTNNYCDDPIVFYFDSNGLITFMTFEDPD